MSRYTYWLTFPQALAVFFLTPFIKSKYPQGERRGTGAPVRVFRDTPVSFT
jgi:hypothetical protein